ncbi:DUF4331 family protein [Gramella sp. KN1008]|uniref:DUF4331 family protein n=1 Tax=Gramella sp. KN1008 TaxID=2529298 RepID=UPI00103E89CB|nr:DUF4331 family protein [Gramella sp. KN1008]TBW30237.1 DUF4331 domain-containing protein [Gramella sp. KN1008]
MKKAKHILGIGALFAASLFLISADHIDAPAVQGGSSDITDFYAFQGENTDNMVFVANVQGLLSPAATAEASFDESVMIEFNIDNNGDFVEDLVIQAVPRNGKMYILGPVAPVQTGLSSMLTVESAKDVNSVNITAYGEEAQVSSNKGISAFAGPRDDPFFMDFAQYSAIIAGEASGFNNPGTDTFAGTNVMSVVIEVPKSMIGGSGTINTWVESKRKQ